MSIGAVVVRANCDCSIVCVYHFIHALVHHIHGTCISSVVVVNAVFVHIRTVRCVLSVYICLQRHSLTEEVPTPPSTSEETLLSHVASLV